jgi:CheY-like chemotaxis protein
MLSANNLEPSSDRDLQSLASIKLKGSVLVAEDNTLVVYVVKKLLTGFGCQVEIASTGEAALQILQTQTFNCGLLDIGLPGLDGIEVTRRYREWEFLNNKPYLPIFALTAHAEEKVKQKCQAAGCDQVLLKPFTEKDIKTIEKFLQ